jgi:hypothetical protein
MDTMNIGMLWFDNDPKADIASKIARAAEYYQKKYGFTADLCYVHPSMLKDGINKAGRVQIKTTRSVLPNHFWIGIQPSSS